MVTTMATKSTMSGGSFNPKARRSSQTSTSKAAGGAGGGYRPSRGAASAGSRSASLSFDVRLTEILADCEGRDDGDAVTRKAGCVLALFHELLANGERMSAASAQQLGPALVSMLRVALPCLQNAIYSDEASAAVTADGYITRQPWKQVAASQREEFETVHALLVERDQYIARRKKAAGELTQSEREENLARINRLEFEGAKARLDKEAAEAKLVAATACYNQDVKRLSSEVARLRQELQEAAETGASSTSHLVGDAAQHIHDVFSKEPEPESELPQTLEDLCRTHNRLEKQLLGLQNVRLAEYEEALDSSGAPSEFPILRESFAHDMKALEEEILALNRHKDSVINSGGVREASGAVTSSAVDENKVAMVTGQVGVNIIFEGPGILNGKTAKWFEFGSEIIVPASTVRMTASLEYQPVPPINILLARSNSMMRDQSQTGSILRPGSIRRSTVGRRSTAALGATAEDLKEDLRDAIIKEKNRKSTDGKDDDKAGSIKAANVVANKANSLHTGHVIECIKREAGLSVSDKVRLPRSISEESLIQIIERVYSGKIKAENQAAAAAAAAAAVAPMAQVQQEEGDGGGGSPKDNTASALTVDGSDRLIIQAPGSAATRQTSKESLLMFFSRYLQERYVLPTIVVHVATDILFAADQYRGENSVIALFAGTLVGEKDEAVWRYCFQWTHVLARMEHRTAEDVYKFLMHFYPSAREDEIQGLHREFIKQHGHGHEDFNARKIVNFLTGCLLKRNEPKLRKWRKILRWKDTHHTSTMSQNDFITIASKFFKDMPTEQLLNAYNSATNKMSPGRVSIETLAYVFCNLDCLAQKL